MSKLCSKCGCECADDAKFCPQCGRSFMESAGGAYTPYSFGIQTKNISFTDAFISFWQNYANFSGRARRKEYWYMVLWNIIVGAVITAIGALISASLADVLSTAYSLAAICPLLALAFRRLHDTGKSGVYILFSLIPIVGWIIMVVFFATDGERFGNRYGESPKYVK